MTPGNNLIVETSLCGSVGAPIVISTRQAVTYKYRNTKNRADCPPIETAMSALTKVK